MIGYRHTIVVGLALCVTTSVAGAQRSRSDTSVVLMKGKPVAQVVVSVRDLDSVGVAVREVVADTTDSLGRYAVDADSGAVLVYRLDEDHEPREIQVGERKLLRDAKDSAKVTVIPDTTVMYRYPVLTSTGVGIMIVSLLLVWLGTAWCYKRILATPQEEKAPSGFGP